MGKKKVGVLELFSFQSKWVKKLKAGYLFKLVLFVRMLNQVPKIFTYLITG
jgi:hypothetical protein